MNTLEPIFAQSLREAQREPQASTKALCAVDGQPAIVPVVVHPANALALVRLCGTGTDKKLGYLPVVWVTLLVWAQMCSNVFKCVQMCFRTLPHLDTFEKCGLLQMCFEYLHTVMCSNVGRR